MERGATLRFEELHLFLECQTLNFSRDVFVNISFVYEIEQPFYCA